MKAPKGKQPISPPVGGAIGTARIQPKPNKSDGVATIGVTRSSREYPKGKQAFCSGGSVKGKR